MRKAQRYLVGFEERTMNGTDLNGCFQGCLQATAFYCASVNYNDKKKVRNMVVVRRESVERCFTVHVNTILLSLESRLLEKAASLGQSIRNATTDADEYYDDYPAEMQGTA
ncbi:unnamed protein product [Nippostrongylus brasiliensis]|uniref:Apple domain-containing protein n=1 Tax=Nippostrongylus brasiliensis TaxID=27835 RepID=A0A0N4YT73_NIPBR|nr:unnamed protein product [Nippostrongylus brasiliensis]